MFEAIVESSIVYTSPVKKSMLSSGHLRTVHWQLKEWTNIKKKNMLGYYSGKTSAILLESVREVETYSTSALAPVNLSGHFRAVV